MDPTAPDTAPDVQHQLNCGVGAIRADVEALKAQIFALDRWVQRQDSMIAAVMSAQEASRKEVVEMRRELADGREATRKQLDGIDETMKRVLVAMRPMTAETATRPVPA